MRRLRGNEIVAISYKESTEFFESLVHRLREHGVVCAITSGMACVALGLSTQTKDCDVLCDPGSAREFLRVLSDSTFHDMHCVYRGRTTPPCDSRWLRGGWTSHFEWKVPSGKVQLDAFGVPPRGSQSWQRTIVGDYVGLASLAEMKQTDRDKDWPFVTGIGMKMIEAGNAQGWLYLFDAQLIRRLASRFPLPDEIIQRRPILSLITQKRELLSDALQAEREFWRELNRERLSVYSAAQRTYARELRKLKPPGAMDLMHDHKLRVACARDHLPQRPIRDYGVERIIESARKNVARRYFPELLQWLPNVEPAFGELSN
jgi:hypothetical protein